jgi:hypothetical protein
VGGLLPGRAMKPKRTGGNLIDAFQIVTLKEGALFKMNPRLITADNNLAKSELAEEIDVWNLNE